MLQEKLAQPEDRLRSLREERGRLRRVADAAKSAAAEHESDQTVNAAVAARDSLREVEAAIEAEQERQVGFLRQLGDIEAGHVGFTLGASGCSAEPQSGHGPAERTLWPRRRRTLPSVPVSPRILTVVVLHDVDHETGVVHPGPSSSGGWKPTLRRARLAVCALRTQA
jgi:hypothetical protein